MKLSLSIILFIILMSITPLHCLYATGNFSRMVDTLNKEYQNSHFNKTVQRPVFVADIVSILYSRTGDPSDMEFNEAGMNIAVDKVNKQYEHIEFNIQFRVPGSKCSANKVGVIAAKEYHNGRVTAFLGPACSYALDPVGRMASAWNIPVYTTGGIGITFSNKDDFPTLTRMASNLESVSDFGMAIIKKFQVRLSFFLCVLFYY